MVCPTTDDNGPLPEVLEMPEKLIASVVKALLVVVY